MEKDGNYYMEGVLDDIQPDGYGFLRTVNYSKGEKDIYISASQIRRFEIKRGDKVTGKVRKPKDNEKYYGLLQVDFVNDENAEVVKTPSLSSFNASLSWGKNRFRNRSPKLFNTYNGFSYAYWSRSTWTYCCTS